MTKMVATLAGVYIVSFNLIKEINKHRTIFRMCFCDMQKCR